MESIGVAGVLREGMDLGQSNLLTNRKVRNYVINSVYDHMKEYQLKPYLREH
jgi:hypothetical protein